MFFHIDGNANNAKLKNINLDQYLKKTFVNSGNVSGSSDITLQNRDTEKYIYHL